MLRDLKFLENCLFFNILWVSIERQIMNALQAFFYKMNILLVN